MSYTENKCWLKRLDIQHSDIITLFHHQRRVVGRNPITKILDRKLSRQQIALVADYSDNSIKMDVIGGNSVGLVRKGSSISSIISKGETIRLAHSDVIYLLPNKYPFRVYISPDVISEKISAMEDNETYKPDYLSFKPSLIDSSPDYQLTCVDNGNLHIFTTQNFIFRNKIAAYDLDGTIITTMSGRVFPKDQNDWKILFPEIPGKLKSLVLNENYAMVIFTNQAGIAKGKLTITEFIYKIKGIISKLSIPCKVLIASGHGGFFRKPRTGLMDYLLKVEFKNENKIDSIFYCGDAAGRLKDAIPGRKKDFSCSDRLFALNCSIPFYTPEEHFQGKKPTNKFKLPDFDPKTIFEKNHLLDPPSSSFNSSSQEAVMMVGIQGSGKTFISQEYFVNKFNYTWISNDVSGNREQTFKQLTTTLSNGKSVVIDNTHPNVETRKKYLDVIKRQSNISVRCFVMNVSINQAKHNNLYRELIGTSHSKINDILFNQFASKYEEPTLNEGFSSIVKVNFVPQFPSKKHENLYRSWLQEK